MSTPNTQPNNFTPSSAEADECRTSIRATGNNDQLLWFPMRVTYNRSLKVAEELESRQIPYFLPCDEIIETDDKGSHVVKVPKISNLIFIHSTKDALQILKHESRLLESLRFITYIPHSHLSKDMSHDDVRRENRIIFIPDPEMELFTATYEALREHITLIPYSEIFEHIGRRIRILHGPLAGREGTLRRIKGNRHVHLDFGGIVTIELDYMPKAWYELIA